MHHTPKMRLTCDPWVVAPTDAADLVSGAIRDDDGEQTSSVRGRVVDGKEFVFVSFGFGARLGPAQSSLAPSARDPA